MVTNAVHGFVSMVSYIVREHQPSSLAVAFDLPGQTFRDEMVAEYKAGRAEAPNDLPPQFEMIREVMHALAIPVVEAPGFEADDVLATLATEARDRGSDVVVVTGDRDSFQLIEDPHVRVLYNRRGVSDYSLYDEAGIVARCGVPPSKYVLLASLRGDPSDNLPGIPGVGEKTAAKLLNAYGDLDGIFSHLDEQTPKLRENLTNNEGLARSNATVIPLVRDVPLGVHVTQLQLGGWDLRTAEAVFAKFELKSQWRIIEELLSAGAFGDAAEGSEAPAGSGTVLTKAAKAELAVLRGLAPGTGDPGEPGEVRAELVDFGEVRVPIEAAAATKDLAALAKGTRSLVARWSGAHGRSPLAAVAVVATEGGGEVGAVMLPADLLESPAVAETLTSTLAEPVLGHQVKEVMRSLLPLGIDCTGLVMDTGVAAYLLDASSGEYELSDLRGTDDGQLQLRMGDPTPELLSEAESLVAEGRDVAELAAGYRARLDALEMGPLHDDIETPLVRVLAKMEVAGIGIDRAELTKISGELKESAAALQATGAGAGRARVQRQLDPAAAHRALRRARPETREEDQDRLLDRCPDPREPARRPSDHRRAALLSRGREAALDLRREPAGRGGRGRPDPRLVPPDGGPDRTHLLGPAEPAQHPGPHRAGQAVPPGLRPRRGLLVPGGRLRPGGAAGDRPPLRRRGADRGHVVGVRRAPGGGLERLPGAGRGGHPHPARVLQDGLLRPGLRHGGLRAEPAPGHRRRRGGRHHRPLLRRLPPGEAVHGRDRGRGPGTGGDPHRVRPPAPAARPARLQLPPAPGGGAPGHERRDPGAGRRHLQAGPGAPRPVASRREGWPAGSSSRCTTRSSSRWRPGRRRRPAASPRRPSPARPTSRCP